MNRRQEIFEGFIALGGAALVALVSIIGIVLYVGAIIFVPVFFAVLAIKAALWVWAQF